MHDLENGICLITSCELISKPMILNANNLFQTNVLILIYDIKIFSELKQHFRVLSLTMHGRKTGCVFYLIVSD